MRVKVRGWRKMATNVKHTKGRNLTLKLYERNENFCVMLNFCFAASFFCTCQTAFHKNKQAAYDCIKNSWVYFHECILWVRVTYKITRKRVSGCISNMRQRKKIQMWQSIHINNVINKRIYSFIFISLQKKNIPLNMTTLIIDN
jgi:hypothetical protein